MVAFTVHYINITPDWRDMKIEVDWTDILIINGLVILVFRKLFSQYNSPVGVCIMSLFSTIHKSIL